ncbi:YciC family protein [Umezawaea beigongshangensis]|uniref:YciC family protein n=1 Tax=Umezawaea beigongshangensis TaxID=2780383 RepID=UPI0018F13630|nr:YciC family protein [Umezawaea beigongshangensis]
MTYPTGGAPQWGEAPKPGVIPLRPLDVGDLFSGAVAAVRSHLKPIAVVSLVVAVVSQLLTLLLSLPFTDDVAALATLDPNEPDPSVVLDALGDLLFLGTAGVFVGLISQVVLSGILTVLVSKAVLGRTIGLGEGWRELKPRLPGLLGLTVVTTVVVFVGALLCVVPGVWIGVLVSLASTALVLEQTTVKHSLQRSRDLVRGAWWRVFGVLALTTLLTVVVSVLVQSVFTALVAGVEYGVGPLVVESLGGVVASFLVTPFSAAVTVLLYIDQRIRRERLDVELAAAAGS